ncbi:VWA domain-containing protein [Candidatus Poribacteria bacterium]|nr:VWA domain-containing protein [Candidatus Poribacteria bacterium]MYF54853.1 VWA domain-containing protein [Candidatus Poribacteria bacterium]
MNFLSPASLFLFGLAIPIIALYILKLRRRREPVSTLMFWEQLFKERQTTSLFQRLKHLLSLLLQLLFLALLVLAVARPQFAFITKSARQLILIVDRSASMNAVLNFDPESPETESRLDSAKETALQIVQGLRFMDEMSVISCHTRPIIHTPFTRHQKTIREAIESIEPTDIKTDLKPAIDLALAVAQTKPNPEIIILSDFQKISEETLADFQNIQSENANPDDDNQEQKRNIKLHLLQIGEENDNVGITQFRVRKSIVNAFDYETLLSVINTSDEEKKCSVELYFNESLFDVRPYTLSPGEIKTEIFSNFTFEGGELKAVLDIEDALKTDNVAYATLPIRESITVLLVTEENPFLRNALAVDEKINLTVATPTEYEANTQDFEVVIFDRYSPTSLGDGNFMFIYPPNSDTPPNIGTDDSVATWKIGEEIETPIITEWERTHPILQHVQLENVLIGKAYAVTPPPTSKILVRSFEAPVVFVDVTPKRKIVFAAINILESDLPLRIAFPVIMANTITWFVQGDKIEEYHLLTGEVLRYKFDAQEIEAVKNKLPQDETVENPQMTVKITGPDDETWDIPIDNDELLFDQTQLAGFYALTLTDATTEENTDTDENIEEENTTDDNGFKKLWAINLASETEASINAIDGIEELVTETELISGSSFFRFPPWIYLVFLAVILSVVEWFMYQRRKID